MRKNVLFMKHGIFILFSLMSFLFAADARCQVAGEVFNPADSNAPKPFFGIKAGVNVQSITGADWVSAYNTGFSGGFFAGLHKNKLGVRLEVLASTTRYKSKISIDTDGNIADFSVVYLNIPLILDYSFIPHLSVQFGPQYSNVVSVTKNSQLYADPKVLYKSGEFAALIGLEAKLPQKFIAGARYIYCFSDMNNQATTSTQTWQNRSVQIYIGYSFK